MIRIKPIRKRREGATGQSHNQSPFGTPHQDTSTPASQDITTNFGPALSTSRSLLAQETNSDAIQQELRNRSVATAAADPSTPQNTSTSATQTPGSGNASG